MILFLLINLITANYIASLVSNSTKQVYSLKQKQQTIRVGSQIIQLEDDLVLEIRVESLTQIDIRIFDKQLLHYQLPNTPPFDFNDIQDPTNQDCNCIIKVQYDPLRITVERNDQVILIIANLTFSEHFIEFTHVPPSEYIFGLGERNQKGFRFREGIYTLMARDEPKLIENGLRPGKHVYSSQPVLLSREQSGHHNLLLYKSASPMDVIYKDGLMKLITIGGIVHLKLFMCDGPLQCISQYNTYLGGWALPPFWSLGFHQSRWGYKNSKKLLEVIGKHHTNKLPIDIIWSDLDYMMDRQIFSVDSGNFTKQDYQTINESGTRYVPLLDVAVGVKYGAKDFGFQNGILYDIFCYSPATGRRLQGYVWPGDSYFPDWFHPNISQYWTEMHHHLYSQVHFDGLWLDMNEPTNFCNGECKWNRMMPNDPVNESYKHPIIKLPYTPGDISLDTKTIPTNLKHYGGQLHKDVHNIYGHMDVYYTYLAQKDIGKILPFQLTRSTFPGTGKYAQHWFGDNEATWEMMYISLGQVFQFQIFGIPMVGADVCGFMSNTTERLCSRWIQLGVLYPFMRNHNNDQSTSQEFYGLGNTVLECAQRNLHLRYSLLKWMYMLYLRNKGTGTVVNPLFFIYPNDMNTLNDDVLDTQLMLGVELMGTPLLEQGFIRNAYFPNDTWYDLQTGMRVLGNEYHIVYCPFNAYVPLYLRSGYLVIQQIQPHIKNINSLDNKYRIIAALDNNKSAFGNFYDVIDFQDEQLIQSGHMLDIIIQVINNTVQLSINTILGDPAQSIIQIEEIVLYGIQSNELQFKTSRIVSGQYLYNSVITLSSVFGGNKQKQLTIT